MEAQKRLSDAKILLEEQNIYSPFHGTIGLFKFRDGSQIQSGDIIANICDLLSLVVEFDIPLSVAKQVRDG